MRVPNIYSLNLLMLNLNYNVTDVVLSYLSFPEVL